MFWTLKCPEEKVEKNWLTISHQDLNSADLLFDGKFFSQALYFLQQSNEKLVKGLLLSIGVLSPIRTKETWQMKTFLGFLPKQPAAYRHRTTNPLLSDLQKFTPRIDELVMLLKNNGMDEKIADFQNTIKKSKKGIQKLKKRSFHLIEEHDKLEKEINAAKAVLGAFDKIINKIDQDMDDLDFEEIVRAAKSIVTKEGLDANIELPNFIEIKKKILWTLEVSVLITLSASMALILDPLESITRYPDSKYGSFNETNPYVKQFKDLHDVVILCLEKAEKLIC